jgi:phage terminase large subunit
VKIHIPLQPKQLELLRLVEDSPATWIGYGGSRGGAKSHGARAVMFLRRLKYPGTRGLVFRRKHKDLWGNHIQPLFDQFPFMRVWYHTQTHELTLPNRSTILFDYAEHPNDIKGFQGQSFMDVAVDEATHLTEDELVFLKTCNRWPGQPDRKCKIILICNPGNVGHAFVKRVFISREYHEKEKAEDYAFLYARAWDNVEWSRVALSQFGLSESDYYRWSDEERFKFFIQNTDYGRTLDRLPQALRIGHLLGDWDQFAGQYFSIFNPAKHVVPAQQLRIEPWQNRWISIDWGFAHNSAIYWHAITETGVVTYRECIVNNMSPRVLAQQIVERNSYEEIKEVVLSHDAFAAKTSEVTIAMEMGEILRHNGLPEPVAAERSREDRISGWQQMYSLLDSGQWLISDACPRLIECILTLTRDEKDLEDVLKMEGDDPADAARYGLYMRVLPARKPYEVLLKERVDAVPLVNGKPDYNAIAHIHQTMEAEERRRNQPVPILRRHHIRRNRKWWRDE